MANNKVEYTKFEYCKDTVKLYLMNSFKELIILKKGCSILTF